MCSPTWPWCDMRAKIPEALAASRFQAHHGVMLSEHLAHVDHLDGPSPASTPRSTSSWPFCR